MKESNPMHHQGRGIRWRRAMAMTIDTTSAAAVQIPYHFRCPISLELMSDPVTVSTGQTYDRSSIESWIATGNSTCPVTRAALSDFTLIPNHTLRRLIQDWCVANRSSGVQRIPTPKQPADPSLLRSLLSQASSPSDPPNLRLSALLRLRSLLARDSDKARASLLASLSNSHNNHPRLLPDLRQVMISILFSDNSHPDDLKHESLAILALLPLSDSDCDSISRDPTRTSYLTSLLLHHSVDVRINSAALVEAVIAGTPSPDVRSQICDSDEVFEGVVGILAYPIPYPRALKVGIKALFALCLAKQHRHRAIAAGAVGALVDRLAEFDKCDAERALATVELLCRIPAGCAAFGGHALTVPLLVKTILKVSDRATEYAAGALLALCSSSEALQREAVAAGVLTQMLLLVQSDCTERAKRKAQTLLKLLRDSWPRDAAVANSDDFRCTDVVPY